MSTIDGGGSQASSAQWSQIQNLESTQGSLSGLSPQEQAAVKKLEQLLQSSGSQQASSSSGSSSGSDGSGSASGSSSPPISKAELQKLLALLQENQKNSAQTGAQGGQNAPQGLGLHQTA